MATASPSTPPTPTAVTDRPRSRRHRILNNPVIRTVLSIWAWFAFGLLIVIWLPMVAITRLVTAPFDKGRYAAGYLFRKFAVAHQILNPLWSVKVTGPMITDPRRPYVMVSNHESFVDILMISHLPWEMKWLAKDTFFKIPVVGWMLQLAGDIRLVRGQKESIVAAMAQCRDRLDKRVCVMIFPEGTRSKTGELGAFKDGAFRLAIETGAPLLPLAVHGAYSALVKGDWRFGVSDTEVRVLDPISTEGMTLDDVATLRDQVRDQIAAAINEMKLAEAR